MTVLGFFEQSQTIISIEKSYEVHAIAVYKGVVFLQILNDLNLIAWLPAWLFKTMDASIPSDWICKSFQDEPGLILGPKFVASDISSYGRMVELEPEPVKLFWQRLRKMDRKADNP